MFTIKEIMTVTQGVLIQGQETRTIKRVIIDSRDARPGDLFIAIKGERYDGHDFINNVIQKGVVAILSHQNSVVKSSLVSIIRVKDTTIALGQLAHSYRMRFKIPFIAITGSAGKTTIKEMLAHVLKQKYNVLYNIRSFNNHIGVPLTLFNLNKKHDIAVLECATNQPGDIAYLANIVRPDSTLFSVIGESHLEKLKDISGVLKEKWQLNNFLSKRSHIFINGDDAFLIKKKRKGVVAVGSLPQAKWRARHIITTSKGKTEFVLRGKQISLNTIGTHHVNNALLVCACASQAGVSLTNIIKALKLFNFPHGRGNIVKHKSNVIIDESYNANPVSMRAAIDLLDSMKCQLKTGRRILIVGDMLELGKETKNYHEKIGVYAASKRIDVILCVGRLAHALGVSARKANSDIVIKNFKDSCQASLVASTMIREQDIILIKGSHAMSMDRIVKALVGKG